MKTLSITLVFLLALFFSVATLNVAEKTHALSVESAANKTKAAEKLTEAKLKICQNKKAAIDKRNNQLLRTANNMLTKFSQIADRVENYYTNKVVPGGKTVSNYDSLVAEITSKKSSVQTALNKAKNDFSAFSCTSDDPKGQITQFRVDMQSVKSSLKEYRTAIKNLIVAIRSVTGETKNSSTIK